MENKEKLKEMIDGCLLNNRKAQQELFKFFYGKMLAICMRYTNDRDTAQEVLQEGFIKIFEKIGTFDYNGSFEGWVRRIIVNTSIDYIRKSKKDPLLTDNDNDFKLGTENFLEENEEMEFNELKAEIAMASIQELTPAYRAVFNLYVIEDFSHKEIAEMLGISEGTSKSNLSKAKLNLQKIVELKLANLK